MTNSISLANKDEVSADALADTLANVNSERQFSLGKVCLALEKFHKTQRSHQHATDASRNL